MAKSLLHRAKRGTLARSRLAGRVILPRAIFNAAQVIKKFGDVPDDLSAL